MASISFQTPEKNNENSPLPRTPTSHKNHELARTSSQKKARYLLDSLRSLKSKGKDAGEIDETAQTSPIHRRNSLKDIFGTIRSKISTESNSNELERPQVVSPSKNASSKFHPKQRKSIGDILGSITNRVAPKRVTDSHSHHVNDPELPEYCRHQHDYMVEESENNPAICTNTYVAPSPPNVPFKSIGEGSLNIDAFEVHHQGVITSNETLQPTVGDLETALDARSWTSQTQTLGDLDENIHISDEERSKTPDSWLHSMIKSFDDFNEPSYSKGKGVIVSPSPSPDKVQPTKPVDFLKDLSPDVIPDHQEDASNLYEGTSSSAIYYTDKVESPERSAWYDRGPVITVCEVGSDSDVGLKTSPTKDTYFDNIQYLDPSFCQRSAERKDRYQGLGLNPFDKSELDRQRVARSIKLTVDKMTKNLHLSSLSEDISDDWDEDCEEPCLEVNFDDVDIHRAVEADDETMRHVVDSAIESPPRGNSPSSIDERFSDASGNPDESLYPTRTIAENAYSNSQLESRDITENLLSEEAIRGHISWFESYDFSLQPMYLKFPQTRTRWARTQFFESGSLAIAYLHKINNGEYSDTLTYYPGEGCIYVHPWGRKLPELEQTNSNARVDCPQTKTQWNRTQIYENKEFAMVDMCKENRDEAPEATNDSSNRCVRVTVHENREVHQEIANVHVNDEVAQMCYRELTNTWNPVLLPLEEQNENEQDLPDFSDVENDFHPATTDSLKSSTSHKADCSINDEFSAGQDMSLFVEAGTPRRKNDNELSDCDETEFDTEMYIGGQHHNSEPFLRGTKRILQYLDYIDNGNSANDIPYSKEGLNLDNTDTTETSGDYQKAYHNEQRAKDAFETARDLADKIFASAANNGICSDISDDDVASLGVRVIEEDIRKSSDSPITAGFKFSQFGDAFDQIARERENSVELAEIGCSHESSVGQDTEHAKSSLIFDFERELLRQRDGSFQEEDAIYRDFEACSGTAMSDSPKENIYILPIGDIGLFEENAGCGDPDVPHADKDNYGNETGRTSLNQDHIDHVKKSFDDIIAAFRRDLQETGLSQEGGFSHSPQELHLVDQSKRAVTESEISSLVLPEVGDTSLTASETQTLSSARAQNENDNPTAGSNEKKEIEILPKESNLFPEIVTVKDLNLQLVGQPARTSQLAKKTETRRVGALVDIFQAHGMMAPASSRTLLHRSPPRMRYKSSPPRPSEKEKDSEKIDTPTKRNKSKRSCRPNDLDLKDGGSDNETDISSQFGETLEREKEVERSACREIDALFYD